MNERDNREDHATSGGMPRTLKIVTAAVAVAVIAGSAIFLNSGDETAPSPEPTSSAVAPPVVAPPEAAPSPEPTEEPEDPAEEMPLDLELDPQDVAESAVLAYLYFDNREDEDLRRERLNAVTTPDSDLRNQPPFLTGRPGHEFVSEGEVHVVHPMWGTDDSVTYRLTVEWGATSWPSDGGASETWTGVRDFLASVVLQDGRWLVESIETMD